MTKYLLALDQAINNTGYAVFKDGVLEDYGIYKTKGHEDQKIESVRNWFSNKIAELRLKENAEIEIAIEDIQMQQEDVRTFKMLAHVQGVLINEIYRNNLPYHAYYASEWKSSMGVTGRDRQTQKKSAQELVFNRYNEMIVQDACDAICIGLHHSKPKTATLNFE